MKVHLRVKEVLYHSFEVDLPDAYAKELLEKDGSMCDLFAEEIGDIASNTPNTVYDGYWEDGEAVKVE